MPIVEFDPAAFRESRPQLAALTDAELREAFAVACLILDNSEASPVPYDPESGIETRATLLNLLVCHLATLSLRGEATGALASATEGAVSVTFTQPLAPGAGWFAQTPCGLAYWQATAGYRLGGRWHDGAFR